MSTLYTCYSPKGEKFELSKANYMDVTTHHGFTTTPPSDLEFVETDESEIDESEIEDELEQDESEIDEELEDADEAVSEDADESEEEEVALEDAAEEEVAVEQEELSFENAAAAKEYLRGKGVQFDGRLSLADLTDLANGKAA